MRKLKIVIAAILIVALMVGITACGSKSAPAETQAAVSETTQAAASQVAETTAGPKKLKKVRIGFFGNTCEAGIFAAYEKGFFKAEGLDVELIKGDANTLKDGLATNKIDITDGLLNQWLKPIEQGLNARFVAGIHTGCIQVLVPSDSTITAKDFKGKTIGVPAMGGGPMILVSRLLYQAGLDSKTDVTWKVFPNAELPIALEKGEVDVIAVADPFAQIQVNSGKAKSIYDSAVSEPFNREYCCLAVSNGTLLEKDPSTVAATTRAILKGAEWVNSNQEEIAKIMVEKKYVPGDAAVNAQVLATYNYMPSVEGGQQAVITGAKEMKEIGVLDKDTDADALAKAAFVKLDGVQ